MKNTNCLSRLSMTFASAGSGVFQSLLALFSCGQQIPHCGDFNCGAVFDIWPSLIVIIGVALAFVPVWCNDRILFSDVIIEGGITLAYILATLSSQFTGIVGIAPSLQQNTWLWFIWCSSILLTQQNGLLWPIHRTPPWSWLWWLMEICSSAPILNFAINTRSTATRRRHEGPLLQPQEVSWPVAPGR